MKRTNKGFTLVELIIVIAVIGVLAAILIPVFSNVVNKANQKSAYSDAKNLVTSMTSEYLSADAESAMSDTLVFAHKGNKVYVFGYNANAGSVSECGEYDYDGSAIASFANSRIAELIAADIVSANSINSNDVVQRLAQTVSVSTPTLQNIIRQLGFDPAEITVVWGYDVNIALGAETVSATCAATIDGVEYTTVNEVFNNSLIRNGSKINVYADEAITNEITIPEGQSATLNLNGHELTWTAGTLITVDGTLTIKGGTLTKTGTNTDAIINVNSTGKLIVSGCNITTEKNSIKVLGGTVDVINNSTIDSNVNAILTMTNESTVNVKGSTVQGKSNGMYINVKSTVNVEDSLIRTKNTGSAFYLNTTANGICSTLNVTGNTTLEGFRAVALYRSGATVRMSGNITINAVESGIRTVSTSSYPSNIYLDGVTITCQGYTGTSNISSGVDAMWATDVQITNCTITNHNTSMTGGSAARGLALEGGSTPANVVITNSHITSDIGYGIVMDKGDSLEFNGGSVTAGIYALCNNGNASNAATTMTLNAGTFTGETAIYHPGKGTLTIHDGVTVTGTKVGIEMRAGTLNIDGGTVENTNSAFSCVANGNGTTTAGAAIAVIQHTTKDTINVNVTGGTVNGAGYALYEANPQNNSASDLLKITIKLTGGTINGTVSVTDTINSESVY